MHLRYFIRLVKAYVTRFKAILIISILIGITSFFLGRIIIPKLTVVTERIGLTGRYHPNELPESILSLIGNGLTQLDESGLAEPALAESWETPDKGKTWVFHLKDNIFWHDETKVTSKSLNYAFSDAEVETPDEKTIIFKLKDPYSPFPQVVSRPVFKKGLIGTGEWEVKKVLLSGNFVQEILIVDKRGQRKLFRFYPTDERTKVAFKLGHVDQVMNILDPTPFDKWSTVDIKTEVNKKQVVALFFNTKDPFLSDKSVRQALTYAFKKESFGLRAISPISPDSWAYNPQVKKYGYDQTRSKEIIDDLPKELTRDLQIKLVSSPALLKIAENIAKDWNNIGINTIVQVSSIIPQDFSTFLTIYDIPDDPDQYPLWHSTQTSTNISNYSNPRIDKLLEDGRVLLDFDERRKIYLDFQRFLLEDVPAAFIVYPEYHTITRR